MKINQMLCWKCGFKQENSSNTLPFRATCEKCHAWLHCCKNCKNFQYGLPNHCKIPDTEYIADREAFNFCEEFQLLGIFKEKNTNTDHISKKLFGEEDLPKKKDFNSLFDS